MRERRSTSMFSDLNRVLEPLKTPDRFVTLAALELRSEDRVTVALAGHLPVLRLGKDAVVARVENQHVPVGIASETRYASSILAVTPGDLGRRVGRQPASRSEWIGVESSWGSKASSGSFSGTRAAAPGRSSRRCSPKSRHGRGARGRSDGVCGAVKLIRGPSTRDATTATAPAADSFPYISIPMRNAWPPASRMSRRLRPAAPAPPRSPTARRGERQSAGISIGEKNGTARSRSSRRVGDPDMDSGTRTADGQEQEVGLELRGRLHVLDRGEHQRPTARRRK